MEWLLGWLVFSIVAGIVAGARGRSGMGYFLLSMVLSPLVGLILAIALPSRQLTVQYPGPGDVAAGARVPCPQCAEPIMAAAKVCRFCGFKLPTVDDTPPPPDAPVTPRPGAYKVGHLLGSLLPTDRHRYPPDR